MNDHFSQNIYALCDFSTLKTKNISLEDFILICTKFNTKLIQYRDKINPEDIQKKNLQKLKSLTDIPIIINDKLELLSYCDGLHLGQEDLAKVKSKKLKVKNNELLFKLLRKKYPGKLFGISTHNEKEILEANRLDIDYIGLGAYRNTSTKEVSNILGEKISYLAKISKHPVAAIGGVKLADNIKNITYYVIGSGLYD